MRDGSPFPPHWVGARLREVVRKLVDGSHNPPEKRADGLPMLSAINIANNQIIFSTYRLIDQDAFNEEDRRTDIQPGDVLLTIVGAIGRSAIVDKYCPKFTVQRSVAVFTPIKIDPKFIMYQLESPRLSRYLLDNARGTAQKGIYLNRLGELEIWFPSIAEQQRIVAKIEELFSELDKGVESLRTAQEQLKAYRQAVRLPRLGCHRQPRRQGAQARHPAVRLPQDERVNISARKHSTSRSSRSIAFTEAARTLRR